MSLLQVYGVYCVLVTLGIVGLYFGIRSRLRSKKSLQPEKVTPSAYTWDCYMADIDAGFTVDEILEKSGGKIPRRPEKYKGPVPSKEFEGRLQARLAWYNEVARTAPILKVVPPPSPGKPVVAIPAFMVPCPVCSKITYRTPGESLNYGYSDTSVRNSPTCKTCKGRGMIPVEKG